MRTGLNPKNQDGEARQMSRSAQAERQADVAGKKSKCRLASTHKTRTGRPDRCLDLHKQRDRQTWLGKESRRGRTESARMQAE